MAEHKDRGTAASQLVQGVKWSPYCPQTPHLCINLYLIQPEQFGVFFKIVVAD